MTKADAKVQQPGCFVCRKHQGLEPLAGGPHLHLWIVPRYPGTPREYWGQ
jgi:hypothetical protein